MSKAIYHIVEFVRSTLANVAAAVIVLYLSHSLAP